ncbi:hypothetical protein [Meiothermus sp.]|jgi:hypothetical protein|uniref:hypothetical protein n=1 Tax=Meiothermus sp. TaxID=1955249 RepID=UPI0021DC207A|nr:hypothetical protein [Meiothermus sp.]GIW25156.1 MAG: hypothetical protein KatS3mg069_1423 [Meiothermus sp.]
MANTRTFLLQLWQDPAGLWAVLRDEQQGQLYQFESLEALTHFLSQLEGDPLQEPSGETKSAALGLE